MEINSKIIWPHAGKRTGLTLLELLVVLTILIALSGIVVATLPGLLTKTQTATAAANVPEIHSALQRNAMLGGGAIGDRFDSLVTAGGQIPAYVGGGESMQVINLSAADVNALQQLGITELVPAADAASETNATFRSHVAEPVPLGSESKLCGLSSSLVQTMAQTVWNIEVGDEDRFLLLGVGQQCSLVGAGPEAIFSEAPLHFSDSNLSNPDVMYSRYMIVVQLLRSTTENDDGELLSAEARYLGVVIPTLQGIEGMSSQLEQYYAGE